MEKIILAVIHELINDNKEGRSTKEEFLKCMEDLSHNIEGEELEYLKVQKALYLKTEI